MSKETETAADATTTLSWLKLPDSVTEVFQMCCQYKGCSETTLAFETFRKHFMDDHFPPENSDENGDYPCGVVACRFSTNDVTAYRRHLSFHLYHAYLQLKGAEVYRSSKQKCVRHSADANNVYYEGYPLHCIWDNCNNAFDSVFVFFMHVASHGEVLEERDRSLVDGKFACLWLDCSYRTKRKFEIISHLRHHTGEKAIACPYCGAMFANNTKLLDHAMRLRDNSSRLKCFFCNKLFPSERLLRDHNRRHMNNYKCSICDLTLPTPSSVRWHVKHRHSTEAPHVCPICSKGFKASLDLERHRTAHSNAKPHQCEYCEKTFKWKQSLTAHLRSHQGEQSVYMCHLCPKQYRTGSLLGQHLSKTHQIPLLPGHSRYTYKKCADGYLRVLTERYELATVLEHTDKERQQSDVNLV